MPLSARSVDQLFARLLIRYGGAWLRMWEGLEIDVVKADWMRELAHLSHEAIAYGIDNLPPDRPPNVTQFKALCNQRRVYDGLALPAPKADPKKVAEIQRKLAETRANLTGRRP